ncbi:hypothetical protein AJ79_07331 [Helicocarpus griseus UAMH5409]|uniref:Glucanase n=1 Tax=Helicocarpus griseus UAMH5409 TaxID=1447875 RepID=A0A2B7X4D5_9EURO|nr:hypothetical protein AJ79_07331 [Helicocarpus griseus UAMH5409]
MQRTIPLLSSLLLGLVAAQTPVDSKKEVHPKITTWKCTKADGCVEHTMAIALDSASHPVYQKDNPEYNCGVWGGPANSTVCPDVETCAQNCVIEGISDYSVAGVSTEGSDLHLRMLNDKGDVLTPRVYLLAENEEEYEMLQLTGKEFTFDVDVSKLPCGMNGALYLSEMPKDGAKSELAPGGAAYGMGYCDAQCYATPFINGLGNINGAGACCNEMDIWEANARATHLAPHPCSVEGIYLCEGAECEFDGVCDKNGCGLNPYKTGNHDFYGLGLTVDTSRPFTVVTQFPEENGLLKSMHRLYIQDGKIIENAVSKLPDVPEINYLNDEFCAANGGTERYMDLGATEGMGQAMTRGMVLAMSIWWDEGNFMQWMDGGEAGPCNETEGDPKNIVKVEPQPALTFGNMKWGDIDSTYELKDTC